MPKTQSSGNKEEVINHFGLVRFRLNGAGNLKLTLFSLDDVKSNVLAPIVMNSLTNIEPTRLSNFTQQRAYLDLRVTEINEYFTVSKIIVFTKAVATSFPGN